MLSEFVTSKRNEIIARCRKRVAARMSPPPTEHELVEGIPMFLDQLARALKSEDLAGASVAASARTHGAELMKAGFSIGQVVSDYGDVCQIVTELTIETGTTITTKEFQTLNYCLDVAIAGAVTTSGSPGPPAR